MFIYPHKAVFGWDGVDVKKFQEDHRHAWNQTVKDKKLTDETLLVVELFELVEVAETGSGTS